MQKKIELEVGFKTQLWPIAYGITHKAIKIQKFGFYMPQYEDIYLTNNLAYIHGYDPSPRTTDCITETDDTSTTILHNFINFMVMCKNRNTNAIDSLYTEDSLIENRSKIFDLIIENRDLFVGPTIYHAYYEHSIKLFNKLLTFREPSNSYNVTMPTRKRNKKTIKLQNHNFDPELAVNSVRLMNQAVEWCTYHSIDLLSDNELHMDIIKGEINFAELQSHFETLKQRVETMCPSDIKINSDVKHKAIRKLLKNCLEEHYGTMKKSKLSNQIINEIDKVLEKYKI